MSANKLFVFSGASGVGKSTVLKQVMQARPELLFSVSATTRPPREGEIDGVSYYFVTKQQFEQMIDRGEFLEYNRHNDNYYGTPWPQLAEKLEKAHIRTIGDLAHTAGRGADLYHAPFLAGFGAAASRPGGYLRGADRPAPYPGPLGDGAAHQIRPCCGKRPGGCLRQ